MRIHKLASGFHEAKEAATRIQMDLNLKIVELWLKAQPSTPPEVREQRVGDIQKGLGEIEQAVQSCTTLLEESFRVLTNLQEDPTIQRLETKVWEIQMQYDSVRGMA